MAYGSTSYGGGSGQSQANIKIGPGADSVAGIADAVSSFRVVSRFGYERTGPTTPPRQGLVNRVIHPVFLGLPSAATDSVTAALVPVRTATDSVAGLTDSATRGSGIFARTTADAGPASDADVRQTSFFRSAADTVTEPTDLAVRAGLPFARTLADSLTTTDSTVRALLESRTAVDSITAPTDALTQSRFEFRTTNDTLAPPADSPTRIDFTFRSGTDTAPASDAATRANYLLTRFASDSAPASDAATRLVIKPRAVADTVEGLVDSVVRVGLPFLRGPPDSITGLADAATRQVTFARTTSDTTTPSETNTRIITRVRSGADTAPSSDADVRQTVFFRTSADTVAGIADAVARKGTPFARSLADTAPSTDSVQRLGVFARLMPGDSAPAADTLSTGRYVALFPDSITTQTNLTGGLSDINHSVVPADTTWMLGSSASAVLYVTMQNPNDDMLLGPNKQTIRLRLRPTVATP